MSLCLLPFVEFGFQGISSTPYNSACLRSGSGLSLAMTRPSTPHVLMAVQRSTPTELFRRTTPEGGSRAAKRARASKPKVKSGCLTCKQRRVKCDETKPECLRCQRFGRICDGYPEPLASRSVAMMPLQPRIPYASLYTPSLTIPSSEDESRYFQSFVDHSAKELSGFFESSFWTRLVLQESQSVTPIRHAIIAIGALSTSLESAPGPGLKVNVIQSIHKRHHEYAVLHYLKAVQALNKYLNESDSPLLRTALVACLLFICFETFSGSYATSVQQTYGGLKILRSYYQAKPVSKRPRTMTQLNPIPSSSDKKATRSRSDCDSFTSSKAIAMHIDEYLESGDELHTTSEGQITSHDPSKPQHDHPNGMRGTSFWKEKQRTIMALPARKRSLIVANVSDKNATAQETKCRKLLQPSLSYDTSRITSATSNSTESPTSSARKSSVFSNSSIATSAAYTPSSNGTHTSSSSQVPQGASSRATNTDALKRPLASRSPIPQSLHNDCAIEEILIQTFTRLDGQGLFFGMVPGIPPLIWDIHATWHLPIPSSFPNFASAQRCWDFLQDRALQFYRRTAFHRAYASTTADAPEKITAEYNKYLRQLSNFAEAFQPILDAAIAEDGVTILDPAAVVLSLYHKITVITLAAIPSTSEMAYDIFLPDFKTITRHSALLIAAQHTSLTPTPRFTFEVGLVPPLHVVATKCRDPGVRREAVELLFASPRQEGMWDSVLSARIGRWMMKCEEGGLEIPPESASSSVNGSRQSSVSLASSSSRGTSYPSPTSPLAESIGRRDWVIPEENRVRLMMVDFHVPERHIRVRCQKVLPGADGTCEERETVIAW